MSSANVSLSPKNKVRDFNTTLQNQKIVKIVNVKEESDRLTPEDE